MLLFGCSARALKTLDMESSLNVNFLLGHVEKVYEVAVLLIMPPKETINVIININSFLKRKFTFESDVRHGK